MNSLLEKEKAKNDKILKPDFSTKSGREFLAIYLHSKFKQILNYDKNNDKPIFKSIHPDFIQKFTKRLINNPEKHFLIGISGESASGKTTICNTIKLATERLDMPIEILSADNYFRDISALISKHGSFDKLLESGYDVDSPNNFDMEQLFIDLEQLSRGIDVKIPQYLVNGTGVVVPNAIPKKAQKIIVVEGMATMYGKVADLFDIKLYVDIEPEIQEKWFLYRAQTPQCFKLSLIKDAHKKAALDDKCSVTDDCGLVINYTDEKIHIISGSEDNIKVTYKEDIEFVKKQIETK